MNDCRVLVVGDVMIDIIVTPEGPIVRGSDRRATIVQRHGGSGANQAAWLAHFGVDVTLAARVGAADLRKYREYFADMGVTPLLAGDVERPTGVLVTLVDDGGERSFLTDRGANLNLDVRDVSADLLEDIDLLVVSGYSLFEPRPRAALLALIGEAKRAGTAFAVDPASVSFLDEFGPGRFLEATQGASMFFPNAEEAELLAGSADTEKQLTSLLEWYDLVAIKRGAAGAVVARRGQKAHSQPAPKIQARDSTGAGDAFLARFVAERCAGASLQDCLVKAVGAGSAAAAMVGGQPPR